MRHRRNRLRRVFVRPGMPIGSMQLRWHELRRLLLEQPVRDVELAALRCERWCLYGVQRKPRVQRSGSVRLQRDLLPERLL